MGEVPQYRSSFHRTPDASELRGNHLKYFKDFHLKAKARSLKDFHLGAKV